ncbi:MAG: ECF transporter S component [Lachnospiraceae bacterium]
MREQTAVGTTQGIVEESKVKFLTITAIGIALVYVFTAFINVRLPIAAAGGLIHLGNVPLFIFAIIFGKKTGAIAGGIGMGLFDLLSGWGAWAPFTLFIVALMGFEVGLITEKKHGYVWNVVAIVLAGVIKVVGYYIAEVILYGNWAAPMASIPGNLVQIGVAAVIVLIVIEPLKKAANKILV